MSIKLQPQLLKDVVKVLKEVTTVANLHFETDGLTCSTMDGAHVSMVQFKIKKHCFESYNIEHNIVAGVQIKVFSQILDLFGKADVLELFLDMEKNEMKLASHTLNNQKQSVTMKILDIEEAAFDIPDEFYKSSSHIRIPSGKFKEICNIDPNIFGDVIRIEIDRTKIMFNTENTEEYCKYSIELPDASMIGQNMKDELDNQSSSHSKRDNITKRSKKKRKRNFLYDDSDSDDSDNDTQPTDKASQALKKNYKYDNAVSISYNEDNPFLSMSFAQKYLQMFSKASTLSGYADIDMGENWPLSVTYNFTNDKGYIRFILAPKIDED